MFYISLWAGKTWDFFTKKFTKSDRAGMVSLRLYDDFLNKVAKPKKVIAVTGTNGKTTTCNFLNDMLTYLGYKVACNKEGANLRPGISKCLFRCVSIFNKPKSDIGIIEFDELSSSIILPKIKPDYVVVTNLFRDTLRRNGHTEYVARKINEGLEDYNLILNADDLISSNLGTNKNKKVFFGIKKQSFEKNLNISNTMDIRICPKCNSKLEFDFIRYHHLGNAKCPKCGFKNEKANYLADNINFNNHTFKINDKEYPLVGDSIFNTYNLLTAITVLKELGIKDEDIIRSIESLNIVESRYGEFIIKDKKVITHFLKGDNSVSSSRVFDYVSSLKGKINVIMILDDQHDKIENGASEFMSWMYDSDYELLNNDYINKIIVGGFRMYDERLRFMMSGLDKNKLLTCENELDTTKYIDYDNCDTIVILYDLYSMELRDKIVNNIKEDLK